MVGVNVGVKVGVSVLVGVFVGVKVGVGVGGIGRISCRCTNTSCSKFVSPGTRFVASESKAIYCPSDEMDGIPDELSACVPFESTEIRVVMPVCVSCMKISLTPLVSFGTMFVASE